MGDAALNPHYLRGDVALMQGLDPGTVWFAAGPVLVLVGDAVGAVSAGGST